MGRSKVIISEAKLYSFAAPTTTTTTTTTNMFLHMLVALILVVSASEVAGVGCPDGWVSHRGQCFLYMRETYSWFDSLEVCRKLGGHLVEDDSDIQHRFIGGLIEQHGGNVKVWIGAQDFDVEGTFEWTNSETLVGTSYWGPNEPNDDKGEGDCVGMAKEGWFDANCEEGRYSFICQLSSA